VIAKMEQAGVPIEIVNKTTLRVRGAKKLVGSDMTTESIRLRYGYAGAIHGSGNAGGRNVRCHRDDI